MTSGGGVTFIRGGQIGWTEKKEQVHPLHFALVGMTTLWKNQRNGDLCAGAGAHCRSLGCARDDKWRVVTFIRGGQIGWTEKKEQVHPIHFALIGMTTLWENQRNGDLCAGAGAHCRSLGSARDDKWRVV